MSNNILEKNTDPDIKDDSIVSWLFRLAKGAVVGTGFIIPGVSGGALAAIFGFYETLLRFVGNVTKEFIKNIMFFLPIGIGGLIGVVLASRIMGEFFKVAEVPLLWFFIGCVLGTLPGLMGKAGEKGRTGKHLSITIVTCLLMCGMLLFMQGGVHTVSIPTGSIWVWLLVGVLMALSAIVPGLSTSTLLIYIGIYGEVLDGIGNMVLSVVVPIMIGAIACALVLAKVFSRLFEKYHAGMYHFVIGLVIASTIFIIPWGGKLLENGDTASYDSNLVLVSIGSSIAGAALGYGMWLLEKKIGKSV